jgi:hypothetical protein
LNCFTFNAIAATAEFTSSTAVIALAVSLTLTTASMAKGMTDDEYKLLKHNIDLEYTTAKQQCNSISGLAKSKCLSEARSIRNDSIVDLDVYSKMLQSTPMADTLLKGKQGSSKSMPIIDDLNLFFKKSRLI